MRAPRVGATDASVVPSGISADAGTPSPEKRSGTDVLGVLLTDGHAGASRRSPSIPPRMIGSFGTARTSGDLPS
jgi:hypothetical protein